MFPPELTTKITIYPQFTSLQGNVTNIRCVLDGYVWDDNSIAVNNKTGASTRFSTLIRIPYLKMFTGRKYISPLRWASTPFDQLSDYWTLDPLQAPSMPIVLNGEWEHEFTFASPTDPVTANRLTAQEQRFQAANRAAFRRAVDINSKALGIPPEFDEDWVRQNKPDEYAVMFDLWQIMVRT